MTPPQVKLWSPAISLSPLLGELGMPTATALSPTPPMGGAFIQPWANNPWLMTDAVRLPSSLWTLGWDSKSFLANFGGIGAAAATATIPAADPHPVQKATWNEFLRQFGNNVYSLDLDFYKVSVNRGSNLCRFPEYVNRKKRPPACTVEVQPNTTARAHGEIRPIKGSTESLITRVFWDFRPNVVNILPNVPDMEIDGAAAVDPPLMTFDRKFPGDSKTSVLSVSGGDVTYENPQQTREKFFTPFGTPANPPPGGHKYWMFRFTPITDSLMAGVEQYFADKAGPLLMWAYLPVIGLAKEEFYKKYNIPFNTFPRRFGDLLEMLSVLWSKDGKQLKEEGPLINPNTEFIDLDGHRKPIPEDPTEVEAINKRLTAKGYAAIGRNRGSVIDWIFGDLAKDPKRLALLKKDERPMATLHFKMRSVPLATPFGQFTVSSDSDFQLNYYLEPVTDPETKKVFGRRGMRVEATPLELNNVDLEFEINEEGKGPTVFHIKADKLKAKKVILTMPSIPGLNHEKNPPLTSYYFEGVEATHLVLDNPDKGIHVNMPKANIGGLRLVFQERDGMKLDPETKQRVPARLQKLTKVEIENLTGKNMDVNLPLGSFTASEATMPKLTLTQSYQENGELRMMSIKIPEIRSKVGLCFIRKKENGEPPKASETPSGEKSPVQQCLEKGGADDMKVFLDGSAGLQNIEYFDENKDGKNSKLASFQLSGVISSSTVKHPSFGQITFSTIEDENGTTHPISGKLSASAVQPFPIPKEAKTPWNFDMRMGLPFVAFETVGRLNIPHGSSTLKQGSLTFSQGTLAFEGNVEMKDAWVKGLSPGETELGRFRFPVDSPNIQNLSITGRPRFKIFPDGWRLSRASTSTQALHAHFDIVDSKLNHHPDVESSFISKLPQSKVVNTEVAIKKAQVEIEDLRKVEVRRFDTGPEAKGVVTELQSGPIAIHHIEGSGSIWVNMAIWGFVRGLFPMIGAQPSSGSTPKRPDPAPLTAHLPEEVKKLLGDGDFFRLGEVSWSRQPNGSWATRILDLLMNLHDEGPRKSFGLIRIPEFNAGVHVEASPEGSEITDGKKPEPKKVLDFDLGAGNFFVNIFLNEPPRGGFFRFVRWPKPEKKK